MLQGKGQIPAFLERGRMLPEGIIYINSWINEAVTVCNQVMESESPEKNSGMDQPVG